MWTCSFESPKLFCYCYGRRAATYTQHWPTSRETLVLQCNLIQAIATSPRIFRGECLCKPTCNHHYNLTQNIAMGGHLMGDFSFISSKPDFHLPDPMFNPPTHTSDHQMTTSKQQPAAQSSKEPVDYGMAFFPMLYEELSSCKEKASRLVFGKTYQAIRLNGGLEHCLMWTKQSSADVFKVNAGDLHCMGKTRRADGLFIVLIKVCYP